jgi:hypothetical protein
MTFLAAPARPRPVSHAFAVPVVREIAPQRASADSAW